MLIDSCSSTHFHEGVPLAILTDGREWSFYLPGEQGTYNDRRVYHLSLEDRDAAESDRILRRYLAADRIRAGLAFDDARSDYRNQASKRVAYDTMLRAWNDLLAEPDSMLMELVAERTEVLCGFRPDGDGVEAFLKQRASILHGHLGHATSLPAVSKPAPSLPIPPQPRAHQRSPTAQGFTIGRDRTDTRTGTEALVGVLAWLFKQRPDRRDAMVAAVRTRGRNHIARDRADIYPRNPQLAKQSVRFLDGWWVGANVSSSDRRQIVKRAVLAAGLEYGRDIEIHLPDA